MPSSAGDRPQVSVILPVWNAEPYLEAAIASILAQSFGEFELLVLDDGSTDGSRAILERCAAGDSRMRSWSRENRGVVATLNELLAEARGELVARMDADDVALPDRLERQVAFLEEHSDVVCAGGAFEVIDDRGRLLTRLTPPTEDAEIQRLALAGHTSILHPSAMLRRSALERVGPYDPELALAEDLDLFLRLGEIGTLANLDATLLRYRMNPGSLSEQNQQLQRRQARAACERAWRRRGISGRFEASQSWRPGPDRASRHATFCRYGWWAFGSRQRRTAILYGARAVRLHPFASSGWRLLACALLKPLPTTA